MTRLIFAGVLSIVGLVLAIVRLVDGQLISFIALAMAAIFVGLAVVYGVLESFQHPYFLAAASIIGVLSIISTFHYDRMFNPTLEEAHAKALVDFISLESKCRPMSYELQEFQRIGSKACVLQNTSDQLTATVDFEKDLHLGPSLSLMDSALSLKDGSAQDYCARVYKAASAICPLGFHSLSKAEREALLSAAGD